jgi:hypothetical protein
MPAPRTRRGALALVLVSAIVAAPLAVAAPAAAAPVSTVVDGVTYTADDAAPLAGATATSYTPGPTALVIPPAVTIGGTSYAVTAIGPNAFQGSALTSIVLPNSLVTIGQYAFTNSNQVTSIVIPDSVTSIGQWAFDSMDLRSLTIGSGLTTIGVQVFSNNNLLESVVIPPGITSIGYAAFAADDLRTLVIGSGVTTIDAFAFAYNNRLSSVVIPASVTSMGNSVFQNNSLGSLLATFEGAEPAVFGTNVFEVSNPQLRYRWRFGDPQTPGGFTSPTWNGYPATAVATVTFDTVGHGSTPADQDVVVGSAATTPPAPTAPGRTFTGWSVAGGGAFDFATLVTGDLDLVAGWSTAPAGGGAASGLPPTGRSTEGALPLAVALLALGGVLLLTTRRSVVGYRTSRSVVG